MSWLAAVLLAWSLPDTREDGTSFAVSDVSHYNVYRNGEYYDTTHARSYEATRAGTYQVQCVDTLSLESALSNKIRIKGKQLRGD